MQALSQLSYGPTRIKLQRFATQVHEVKTLNPKPPQRTSVSISAQTQSTLDGSTAKREG